MQVANNGLGSLTSECNSVLAIFYMSLLSYPIIPSIIWHYEQNESYLAKLNNISEWIQQVYDY